MLKKRSLPLILIFLLVFSSFASAAPLRPVPNDAADQANAVEVSKSVNAEVEQNQYKMGDKVRVIVEMDGAPAITYATKQGLKYSDLSKSVKESLENNILSQQEAVKSQMTSQSIDMDFEQSFTTVLNGFSGEVEYGQIPAIEAISGVSQVTISHEYQRPEEKPEMIYSKEIVEAQKAWEDYGYKGEGMIVGIIDTGIDYRHKDMILTDSSKAALSQDKVNSFIAQKGLPGKFYTDKVPYGYNYADKNDQILDLGPDASMHGMHVAGTAGANGDETKGGIKGIAPEAQLLALKVFGNDPEMPSTWSDIYVKAIDDAIILGADVLNMSLGSTAAFVRPEDPEQVAIKRAVDNGVLMSISAGNSGTINYGYTSAQTLASNPDVGVVGSPGLAYDSLQVASLENNYMDLAAATFNYDGADAKAAYMAAGTVDPAKVTGKFDVVYAGLGRWPGTTNQVDQTANDFTGKDFTGKIALIKRGEIGFVDKAKNAMKAGAVGVIIFNNTDGFINMATDPAITVPYLFIQKTDGDKIAAAITAAKAVTVEFKGDKVKAPNPNAGKMSDFTSWGVTPNLDFKPEITAPGGQIYSTLNNNSYGMMSGTSMAAPHVSGGSALVLQRVKGDFPTLTGRAKVQMAKNLLMNTSKILTDKGTYNTAYASYGLVGPYSPRRQGAGVMQLHAALSTPIVVTEKNTGEAKVALKEISGNTATFTLNVENLSGKKVTYNVEGNVQTDLVINGKNYLEEQPIYDSTTIDANGIGAYPISFSQNQVTLLPHSTGSFDVTVDLTNAADWYYNAPLDQLFKNGYFVEGFVKLTDPSQVNPDISVPYVGFKGDWNKAPILDKMIYDGGAGTYFAKSAMVTSVTGGGFNYLGFNLFTSKLESAKIAISPNGDGEQDDIIPMLSFLRNAKLVEYKITDKDGNVLRKLKSQNDARKSYTDGGRRNPYTLNPAYAWDGKIKNKVAADGKYFYEIDTTLDYDGKPAQVVKVPVIVDNTAPVVTASVKGDTVTFTGNDNNGSGILYYDILLNGNSVFTKVADLPKGDATSYKFAQTPAVGSTVEVVAYDNAGNYGVATVKGINDSTIPYIHVTSPESLTFYNTGDFTVTGYVNDQSELLELKINDENVPFTWNAEKGQYDFSKNMHFADGVHTIKITGTDAAGNTISYNHNVVLVDTTAPRINVDAPVQVNADVTSVDIKATISDNFDELRYFVDGSEEFYKEMMEPYEMRAYSKDVTTHVTLDEGKNTFVLQLEDIVGNKTTKEVTIYRGEMPAQPETGNGDISGTLTRYSVGLGNLVFSFHSVNADQWYDLTTAANGDFTVNVPDGTYQIDGIWDAALAKWYVLNQQFTVESGRLVGADSLAVAISTSENVTGKLTQGGTALANTTFSVHSGNAWYDATTDANGNFGIALPNGTYKLEGIWVASQSKWYTAVAQEFTVNGSYVLNIDVPAAQAKNINGTLTKGNQALGGVVFSFHTTDGTQWYDVTSNADGSFSTLMPNGNYQLDGVWLPSESKWHVLNLQFSVQNGQLVGNLGINLAN